MLRRTLFLAVILLLPRASMAQDRGSVTVESGYSVANNSALGNAISSVASLSNGASNLNIAGRVAFNLAPGFQAIGAVGRIGNVLPPLATSLLSFSPVQVRARAIYEEAGVRAFLGGRSSVNPYVEATGGMAQISARVDGFNATADDLINLGLGLTKRNSPTAGLGAGVLLHAGALTFDAGYRYKKIFARDFVGSLLGGGDDALISHQVAFGVGVRF